MRALVLYSVMATAGTLVAIVVGLVVERAISSPVSTAVFLGLFFANFWASWRATCWAMDRHLRTHPQASVAKVG